MVARNAGNSVKQRATMCRLFGSQRQPGEVHLNLKKMTTTGLLALGLFAAPRMVAAQTMQWTDKGYVSVSGGAQAGSHDLGGSLSFPQYDETATITTTQKVKGGGLFDIGG